MTDNLFLLLKPAGGNCNLRCRYCFYRGHGTREMMTPDTLRVVLTKALAYAAQHCTIAFQGGEPTLAGLDFFKQAVEIAKQNNPNHCKLTFLLQTNGVLIDQAWCDFLRNENFLVGVSLDGPRALHNANRSQFDQTLRALKLLQANDVSVNVLAVLTKQSCHRYAEIDAFFRKLGVNFVQHIPCLEPYGQPRGKQPWALASKDYETYLKAAFDCWHEDILRGQYRPHRYFDNLLGLLHDRSPEACGMAGQCSLQMVVETDGSVYPCDFYVHEDYCLGNLREDGMQAIDQRRRELHFIEQSAQQHPDCLACPWHPLCRGGCRRDRDIFTAQLGKNVYCQAMQGFFAYAWPRLAALKHLTTPA
ncbi:MAG: SPASM domain-containing protein [Oscillospiraceae bacterium]|nr:SPASM domain-containing protein [Oscillospiraceae bacterium]